MSSVIVTGGSRGIGRGIVERFAADGYDVVVNFVRDRAAADEAVELAEAAGVDAIPVQADVADPEDAARLVERAVEAFGGVDHLVNNAGIDQHVHTENLDPGDFDRVMDVNVNGAFNVTKYARRSLVESDADASVTNVSSILAFEGAAVECHYAASKSGLLGLTKSHASDFAPDVRVNAIAPGHVETDMTSDRTPEEKAEELAGIPVGRYGQPEDIAHAAAFLRDAGFVTGETLNVNGGELMR
ncbi:SDR family oxidoreductase [Halocalculus aciditolerans]|uniref:Beta-ketoacyl-ACP reductase n=1 Tax=Halocalculus aciditolerans TaxID=1383812 RepID=A0A830FIC6_9EURY|nr:SDR family oxidoreductase [Halocalculus aciditolerans]GGL55625.1 beta-ketoacyl-ACP reductase [Halocalculus aciditolerans]